PGSLPRESPRHPDGGDDVLPGSRDARQLRSARDGPLAGDAVRVHVAQRLAGDDLLQDPGEPGVRGRGAGRAVAGRTTQAPLRDKNTQSLVEPVSFALAYSTCPNFTMSSG